MKTQMWEKGLLLPATVLATLASLAACQSSETDKCAKQLNLPKEVRTIVRHLENDNNTRVLLDKLCYMPKELQTHEVTLDYLKEVAKEPTNLRG